MPYLGAEATKTSWTPLADCWSLAMERPSTGVEGKEDERGSERSDEVAEGTDVGGLFARNGSAGGGRMAELGKTAKREMPVALAGTLLRAALGGRGPDKCGVLRRVRAGDGPGAKLLPAADSDRATHTGNGATKF